MNFNKWSIISLVFVLGWCGLASSQSLIRQIDNFGYVNWERRVVGTSGISSIDPQDLPHVQRAEALEKAKRSATDNLLRTLERLTFDASSDIKGALIQKNLPAEKLQEIVQYFTIVDTRSMSDMSLEVEIELPLTGRLSDVLLPKSTGKGQLRVSDELRCPICGQPWPEGRLVPEGIKLINLAEGFKTFKGTPYTGLVIDARALGLRPAMVAKILDEDGKEIYGTNFVDRSTAVEIGILAYKKETKAAINDERVRPDPLVIRGLKASGPKKTDVVVSNDDAALIHAAARVQNFLKKSRVILIIE